MMPALYILALVAAVGLVLYVHHLITSRITHGDAGEDAAAPPAPDDEGEVCCGMHVTCERDSLLTAVGDDPEYFDDEELDACAGRHPDSYTDAEIEQFRDVLLTLRAEDIAPWARAIQRRGIELPPAVRDELLMIVAEARASHTPSK